MGIARLCCSQWTARTRTDYLLFPQEEAPTSLGQRGCHDNFPQEDNEEQLRSKLLESGFPKEELDKVHGYNSLFILSKLYNI